MFNSFLSLETYFKFFLLPIISSLFFKHFYNFSNQTKVHLIPSCFFIFLNPSKVWRRKHNACQTQSAVFLKLQGMNWIIWITSSQNRRRWSSATIWHLDGAAGDVTPEAKPIEASLQEWDEMRRLCWSCCESEATQDEERLQFKFPCYSLEIFSCQ